MGETTDRPTMTIKAARKVLSYTIAHAPEKVREAEDLMRALQSRRPGILPNGGLCVVRCKGCGNATWSLHADGDTEVWACDSCHREPMTNDEALALRDARREQAARLKTAEAAEIAARPTPRAVLAAASAALTEARDEEVRLALAGEKARDAVVGAMAAFGAAEEALPVARARAAEAAVGALLDPAAATKKPPKTTVAIETAALEAARAALELATTASETLSDMLAEARYSMRKLSERHRSAALAVLADECGPLFVARATEARTEFITASKGLQWLETNGTSLSSQIASDVRRSWHNLPQSWTTGSLPGPDLDAALAELLADPHASVDLA